MSRAAAATLSLGPTVAGEDVMTRLIGSFLIVRCSGDVADAAPRAQR
jgi:hypothetical protein